MFHEAIKKLKGHVFIDRGVKGNTKLCAIFLDHPVYYTTYCTRTHA